MMTREMAHQPIIQIAGIRTLEEALMVCQAGATHIGFPLRLDFHPEDLGDQEVRGIIRKLPQTISKVLITYLSRPDAIIALARFIGADTVQLHGRIDPARILKLREADPDLCLIRSLVVGSVPDAELYQEATHLAPVVDYFLTDTFDAKTGASGATGKTHDWQISRRLREVCEKPLILAGGLQPSNVCEAIRVVQPAGVDAHTGIEGPDGMKSKQLVEAFVREARTGFGV